MSDALPITYPTLKSKAVVLRVVGLVAVAILPAWISIAMFIEWNQLNARAASGPDVNSALAISLFMLAVVLVITWYTLRYTVLVRRLTVPALMMRRELLIRQGSRVVELANCKVKPVEKIYNGGIWPLGEAVDLIGSTGRITIAPALLDETNLDLLTEMWSAAGREYDGFYPYDYQERRPRV